MSTSMAREVYPKCVPVEGAQDHSRALGANDVDPITAYGISTFASLAIQRDGSENPVLLLAALRQIVKE